MEKKVSAIIVLVLAFSISLVNAQIYFSQPESVYNLGDEISLEINVEPPGQGFVELKLVCDGDNAAVFSGAPNSLGKINLSLPLTRTYIDNLEGKCNFEAKYGGQTSKSVEFDISKELVMVLDTSSFVAGPGQSFTFAGTVTRKNGKLVNGEIEVSIPALKKETKSKTKTTSNETAGNYSQNSTQDSEKEQENFDGAISYGKIIEGKFSVQVNLNRDIPSGDYVVNGYSYEKLYDEKTSEGNAKANLNVKQILTKVDIGISDQNIDPGKILQVKPMLLDQTEKIIEEDVGLIITDVQGIRIFEKIIKSGKTLDYQISTNQTSGYYEISIKKDNKTSVKKFYINEKAIADFEIINDTIKIKNIGNIVYNKDFQVDLNGKPFIKDINLELGESKEFKLTGPDEQYDIKVTDGNTQISKSGVLLTGRSVTVKEITPKSGFASVISVIIWTIFIFLLLGGLFFLFTAIKKKKSFAYSPGQTSIREKIKNKLGLKRHDKVFEVKKPRTLKPQNAAGQAKPSISPGPLIAPTQAEQVLVLDGKRNFAAVISLKIKNKLTEIAKHKLKVSIEKHALDQKAAVQDSGEYMNIIFSPLLTRTTKNEVLAAKSAEKIKAFLDHHNVHEPKEHKIEFGIGINHGEIVNGVENRKLKFTSMGNFLILAKKIAGSSTGQILLSKSTKDKAEHELKCDKFKDSLDIYELKNILDYEQNQKFLQSFVKRMEGK